MRHPQEPPDTARVGATPSGTALLTRLSLFTVALVGALSLVTFVLVSRVFDRITPWAETDLARKTARGADHIAQVAQFGVVARDADEIRRAVTDYATGTEFETIIVADATGTPLFVNGHLPDDIPALFQGPPGILRSNSESFSAWAESSIENTPVGKTAVVVSKARLHEGADLKRSITILAAIACAVSVAISLLFVHKYVAPLIRLTDRTLIKLRELNATLEARVHRRTRALSDANEQLEASLSELRNTQRRLAESSRAAGMAEVATNVLHNVGNVLTTVNIAAGLALDQAQHSPHRALAQLSDLLQNQEDLGAFMTQNPKGKLIVPYLEKLAAVIAEKQEVTIAELKTVQSCIDHIRAIIATQQRLATPQLFEETFSVPTLLEEALRFNETSLRRYSIQVEVDCNGVELVHTDRHRLLQILLNLLSNARDALLDNDSRRRIQIRARHSSSGWLAIEFSDNGSGIAPADLDRIFAHGFTTKSDGHGFGLHGAACAAMELGGTIRVESAGAGHGATFIVEVPDQVRKAA